MRNTELLEFDADFNWIFGATHLKSSGFFSVGGTN
jgi:hypothetical protein